MRLFHVSVNEKREYIREQITASEITLPFVNLHSAVAFSLLSPIHAIGELFRLFPPPRLGYTDLTRIP